MQTVSATTKQVNGEKAVVNGKAAKEKMELPVEMAGMVPLRLLIGKMVSKAYSDLMTLTDTLPAMSDIERKRQILYFTTETRKQFLKLMVLVHWAMDANDIQMCQNIMAFLANQNRMFQESVDYLHKIHAELPAARVRNFDILTAVDVLTTGSYQRMPTKVQDMLPPAPLTDDQVLQTFDKMNDELRIRMLTKEVLPIPMNNYRIANGRIYFCVNNEFEVAMTLMGNVNQQKWWIVSLDILVQPSATGSAADVDITLNETQRQRLRSNAQAQLTPPENDPHFFPLVNLYDYLHLFCLNMQLEILFMQATMMAKTRWMDQLKVQMNVARTTLTLSYWGGGSPTAHWGSPQNKEDATIAPVAAPGAMLPPSTVVEIAIQDQATPQMAVAIRDEWKGLIQKSGLGASVALSDLDDQAKSKVFAALKYPKTLLNILWNADKDLHSDEPLLDPSQLNVERLLLHMTAYHRQSILDKFHTLLQSQAAFLEENGLLFIDKSASSTASAHGRPLMVQFRPDRFVHLDVDSRTGRVKVSETGKHGSDGDVKLRGLEERLNTDPTNLARHLIWLRSEVVVHEIVSLAKQLHWTPFHPTQMLLQPDDMVKLFDDPEPPSAAASAAGAAHPTAPSSAAPVATTTTTTPGKPGYPAHCVFLQFAQFEDWYLVIAVMHNEFQASLCCLRKSDQNVQHQEFVDLIHVEYQQIWKERFGSGRLDDMLLPVKPESHDDAKQPRSAKRRRTLQDTAPLLKDNTKVQSSALSSKTDNLSIDLSFLAKLESLSRYILRP
ncbi:mediator complex subunit MED14-domain-containing protein [Gongronella butleri]|nr:mediator complex subunit MED14-domain-containing protein [Gongronella butleri]